MLYLNLKRDAIKTYRSSEMLKKKKNYNPNRIKSKSSYTVMEVAELYRLHPRTIQAWIKKGLKVLNPDSSPYLIHGEDVRQFLRIRKKNSTHKLGAGEFYCTKCRCRRKSDPRKLSFKFTDKNLGKEYKQVVLKGNCEVCNNPLYLFSSDRKIDDMIKNGMTFTEYAKGLIGNTNYSLNTDIKKEEKCQT